MRPEGSERKETRGKGGRSLKARLYAGPWATVHCALPTGSGERARAVCSTGGELGPCVQRGTLAQQALSLPPPICFCTSRLPVSHIASQAGLQARADGLIRQSVETALLSTAHLRTSTREKDVPILQKSTDSGRHTLIYLGTVSHPQ